MNLENKVLMTCLLKQFLLNYSKGGERMRKVSLALFTCITLTFAIFSSPVFAEDHQPLKGGKNIIEVRGGTGEVSPMGGGKIDFD